MRPPLPDDALLRATIRSLSENLLAGRVCPTGHCQHRRRSSFGYVYDVCGLCAKSARAGAGTTIVPLDILGRVEEAGWTSVLDWGLSWLAGGNVDNGPVYAPYNVVVTRGRSEGWGIAPAWVNPLLLVGTKVSHHAATHDLPRFNWPGVFKYCVVDLELRAALGSVVGVAAKDQSGAAVYELLRSTGFDDFDLSPRKLRKKKKLP